MQLIIAADCSACLILATSTMIGYVSAHSEIFYMHAKVHNPGKCRHRIPCVQILIGDRQLRWA
jgi:hypothetical protein